MNIVKNENFRASLISQYRLMIQEAIMDSETNHRTSLDIGRLYSKLQVIHRSAQHDGLNEAVVDQLINEAIPNLVPKAA